MLRYLALRVLYMLPVVWLVVSLVFLLIHLVPGDPILQMLGEGAPVTDVQAARHAYGLDLPLDRQYLNYWEGVLQGDLGPSLRFNQSVTRLIAQRYPYTLQLTLAALVVAVLLSVPAGVRSAQRRNRWDDRLLSVVSLFGLSFPNFALGPILILLFCHLSGMASGVRFRERGPLSTSRNHHGWRAGRHSYPHGPYLHAGRAGPGLHPDRPRQRIVRTQGCLRSRSAQCHDPGDHGAGTAIRRPAGRRHRDRNNFFLARNRTVDHPGYLQSRLLPGAGLHSGDWAHLCGGEFSDGFAVFGGEPADP